jgi:NADPH:quinone reductase-like Zn-dependent oxidoreductase
MMKAVICEKYGPPDVLEVREVTKPQPQAYELLVKVHASTVGPADMALVRGEPPAARVVGGLTKPKIPIPGSAFTGVVEATGLGVKGWRAGDAVFGSTVLAMCGFAEYLCVREDGIVALKPPQVSHAQAAGICDGWTTALTFLRDKAQVREGQRVLVNGASGSVGAAAVQLAKYWGAEVTGVCSGANVPLVQALGADDVIDYTQVDFTQPQQTGGRTWDVIFDAVGKSSYGRCAAVLTPHGVYMLTVPTGAIFAQMLWTTMMGGKKAIFAATGLNQTPEKLNLLAELMAEGAVRAVIDRSYRLDEVAAACRYVETGRKRGDVVLAMVDDVRDEVRNEEAAHLGRVW